MNDRIQPGIFFRPSEKPAACWRLLLLNIGAGASPDRAREALTKLQEMLLDLRGGHVRELTTQPEGGVAATRDSFSGLNWLWGYGRRLFDHESHQPRLTQVARPDYLAYLPRAGNPFPSLPWDPTAERNGEADLALQLTANMAVGVNRAAVEIWKLIEDAQLALQPVASFDGFVRPDGRGWLEFHDGVSNIESSQRLAALEVSGDPAWMTGGTYMAFLRCRIHLDVWRRLERPDQELIVGRDKLTGSALIATRQDSTGRVRPVAAPPLSPTPSDAELADYHDPPQATDALLEASHLHRVNQNRASPHAPSAWRMFRQGYDFLESIGPDGPRLGLNFVGFQADLAALQHILHLPGWLADVNFGGPTRPGPGEPESPQLVSLLAGGFYAVPPRENPFPGVRLFSEG